MKTQRTLEADLELLRKMFAEDFDWHQWYDDVRADSPEDVFRRAYKWHDYRQGNRPVGTVDCGGHVFDNPDSPKALYRVLYLLEPSQVDFSNMHKTGTLVDFLSPDSKFCCSFQLFKYKACLRFDCAPEFIAGRPHCIQAGAPDADNGTSCNSELGNTWFQVAVESLTRVWEVYPGNEFSV